MGAILIGTLSQQDSNSPTVNASPPSTSSPTGGTSSTPPSGTVGKTPSDGTVTEGPAAALVKRFYDDASGSWSTLTPAAQKLYGSETAFRQYWTTHTVENFSSIRAVKAGNNSDGSLDIELASLIVDGQDKAMTLRVISSGGKLLLDSDTRFPSLT
ncbi:hypothetical protein NONI108955_38885 [Nocardia ninae]